MASGLPSKGFLPGVVCSPTVALAKVGADGSAHAITHKTTTAGNIRHVMAAILLAGGTEVPPLRSAPLRFSFRLINVRRLAEEDFGGFHQCLGEGRMRMDRQL